MASRNLQLLIVDDNEAWRDLLKALFRERTDIVITEAVSGNDAIEKIKSKDYDLVLLDMRMPTGTEGFDALSEIKRLKPLQVSPHCSTRSLKGPRSICPAAKNFNQLAIVRLGAPRPEVLSVYCFNVPNEFAAAAIIQAIVFGCDSLKHHDRTERRNPVRQ